MLLHKFSIFIFYLGRDTLINTIRREKLRAFLEENQVATLRQIEEFLPDVSLMTIHRDLNYLQEQGLAVKIRGGARSAQGGGSEPVFTAREIVNRAAKMKIAEKAVRLLSGSAGSVFLDAGTTMLALARLVPDMPVSVVTTGPNIALELCRNKSMTITLCGGVLHKSNLILTGAATMDILSDFNIDVAFLVAAGYSPCAGFSCGRESEAQVKGLVAQKARTRVMLLDSSKLERVFPHTFAQLENSDYMVTEVPPEELPPAFLEKAGKIPGLRIV